MQKQHLHALLLVFGCCFWGGCGEPSLRQLNPYLHGKQELTVVLPDSGASPMIIRGWEFPPLSSYEGQHGRLKVLTPDGRRVSLDWVLSGGTEPVLFSKAVRSVHGVTASNSTLGLTVIAQVAPDGRSLTCQLAGESSQTIKARIAIDIAGVKKRGLAAFTDTWSESKSGMDIALPWGDSWKLDSKDEIIPLPGSSTEISAEIDFGKARKREYSLHWSPLPSPRGKRGLDIDTELMSNDQALAFLIASIPPVHQTIPSDPIELETAADLTRAQWLVHAEYSPDYLNDLSVAEDQVFLLTYGLAAYQTLYAWGTVESSELLAKEPLLDAAMSRIDTTSREIERGASIEDRLREGTLWTFAEENLATDRPLIRKVYREQALIAIDDAQNELKRRVRLWRRENSAQRKDTLAQYEQFVGGDSTEETKVRELFVVPDSLAILKIVGRGSLSWLNEVSPDWHAMVNLPWPLEMERLRFHFGKNIKNRLAGNWEITQRTMLDIFHPGVFPRELFGAEPLQSAAAEIETVVEAYLGIKPEWRERTITFDARLPEGWGRTKARVPFADGELYVDYDFANKQAWVGSRGLKEIYTCQFYMPSPGGAISGQFKLEPGESPRMITLVVENGNKYRLRFESDGLPE